MRANRRRSRPSREEGDDGGGATTLEEFRRSLGSILLKKNKAGKYIHDAAGLARLWDRGTDGTVNLAEFRIGIRKTLGLKTHVAPMDEFFKQIDKGTQSEEWARKPAELYRDGNTLQLSSSAAGLFPSSVSHRPL